MTWGMSPKAMEWLYKAVIRPIVEYACLIWCPALNLKTVTRNLEKVQRLALTSITAAYPSTPTGALETLLNIPPLHLYIQGAATKMAHRLMLSDRWEGKNKYLGDRKSHIDTTNRLLGKSQIFLLPVDKLSEPQRRMDTPYEVDIPPRAFYSDTGPPTESRDADEVICFTDGSKTKEGTGAGLTIRGNNIQKDISLSFCSLPTVYQMEIHAISATADELITLKVEGKRITIYSDSQAAVNALRSNPVYTRSTLECIDRLRTLSSKNSVKLLWIPAHQGYHGNEAADELAKNGANDPYIGPCPSLPISLSTVRRVVNDITRISHRNEWTSRTDCRQTKMFRRKPEQGYADELLKMSRKEIRDAIQIISGHANLARHRYLCHKEASPLCMQCNSRTREETAFHFIAECSRFGLVRFQTLGQISLEVGDLTNLQPRTLVTFTKRTKRLEMFGDL